MKSPGENVSFLVVLSRALLGVVVCLALVLVGGAVYFFAAGEDAGVVPEVPPDRVFTGIGRLRLAVKGGGSENGPVAILSITFPYAPEDRPFSEELAARVGDFRDAARDYFLSFTSEELKERREEEIKGELLGRFNGMLRLGKIETLYFSDFLILE